MVDDLVELVNASGDPGGRKSEEEVRKTGKLSPEGQFRHDLYNKFMELDYSKEILDRNNDSVSEEEYNSKKSEFVSILKNYKGNIKGTLGGEYDRLSEIASKFGLSLEPPPEGKKEQ